MKIEKRPNGMYRVRKMHKGKMYEKNYTYKPKLADAIDDINALIVENPAPRSDNKLTVEQACKQYIQLKSEVLSPSTIAGYNRYLKNLPDYIKKIKICDMDKPTMQCFVSDFAQDHSPKYVKNMYNFIQSSIKMFDDSYNVKATLPRSVGMTYYEPSDEDVRKLIEASVGTKYEACIMLGIFGVSRSEMCAIEASDVSGDILHIHKAKIQDPEGNWIIKNCSKTDTRNRNIAIPQYIADMIVENGCVIEGVLPNAITDWMYSTEDALGIPRFSVHKLRHYFASKMDGIVDRATLLAMGGWKTSHVMEQRYRYSLMKEEDQKRSVSQLLMNQLPK